MRMGQLLRRFLWRRLTYNLHLYDNILTSLCIHDRLFARRPSMHRTTVSFGDEDWRKLQKMALSRRMKISHIISLAVAKLSASGEQKRGAWKFDWKPKPLGKPNVDFRTR